MSETRYRRHFDKEGNETQIPYNVSDEKLQVEADEARLKEIIAMAHSAIKVPILAEGFALLCKRLGIT